jgi:anti-sigma regulatory factor (Ser/Thr protein kinase)
MSGTGARISERIELPPALDSPRRARVLARELLADQLPDARRRNDLLILVTELVTNAVRHAGLGPLDAIELRLVAAAGVIRAEVRDPGPGFVPPKSAPGPAGGFGLVLLRTLSDRWGISAGGPTCVWFEIDA